MQILTSPVLCYFFNLSVRHYCNKLLLNFRLKIMFINSEYYGMPDQQKAPAAVFSGTKPHPLLSF